MHLQLANLSYLSLACHAALASRRDLQLACRLSMQQSQASWLAQVSTEEVREMEARWSSMGIDSKMPAVDEDITEVLTAV